MIEIYENTIFNKHGVASYLYVLFANCINPNNNRAEHKGKPMNSVELCAFANLTMGELQHAVRGLIAQNAILIVRGKHREYYYVNPQFMRDPTKKIKKFEWLITLFNDQDNQQNQSLVRLKKMRGDIHTGISETINELQRG